MLPQDIVFDNISNDLQDVFAQVIDILKISKEEMQLEYNRDIRLNNYQVGDHVWLKVKFYKPGENRKLAPRRDGPWEIVEKRCKL